MEELVTRGNVQSIVDRVGLDECTAKSIRLALEEMGGLEPGALKAEKAAIARVIDEVLAEASAPSEPTTKAAKSFSCTTRSGTECPKNIKSAQAKNALTVEAFLSSNKRLEIDVDGNVLTGEPRQFSSGNLGWYLTGKIELEVAGRAVWAQVGMNVTIPGSQSWKMR